MFAKMVTVCVLPCPSVWVATANAALLVFGATTIDPTRAPAGFRKLTTPGLQLRLTTAPSRGAGPLSVTWPLTTAPPVTLFEARPTLLTVVAATKSVPELVAPPTRKVALTGSAVGASAPSGTALNVAVRLPAPTTTDVTGLPEASVKATRGGGARSIVEPPAGATPLSVSVPTDAKPPMTWPGTNVGPVSVRRRIVRFD